MTNLEDVFIRIGLDPEKKIVGVSANKIPHQNMSILDLPPSFYERKVCQFIFINGN